MLAIEAERRPIVLVAEPQALPGMWLEDVLTGAGCDVRGPYGTCRDATENLGGMRPDFALLSVDLNQGPCFPLACLLRRSDVPFALVAGTARVPAAFCDVPLLDRLCDGPELVGAVDVLRARRGEGSGEGSRDGRCPMRERIAAGEAFALDQCPAACRG